MEDKSTFKIKIILISFWIIILLPLLILTIIKFWDLYGHEVTVGLNKIVYPNGVSIINKDKYFISTNSTNNDSLLMKFNDSYFLDHDDFEIYINSFSFPMNQVIIQLEHIDSTSTLSIQLFEEDGDSWNLKNNYDLNGLNSLSISFNLSDCKLNTSSWLNNGLTNISRIVFKLSNGKNHNLAVKSINLKRNYYDDFILIPINFIDAPVRVSAEKQKPNGTYRIVFLGDSMTYGQGFVGNSIHSVSTIPYDQIFAHLLEEKLNEELSGDLKSRSDKITKFEILNFAVPGYNSEQEVDMYENNSQYYDPDLVVIFFYGNDLENKKYIYSLLENISQREDYKYLTKGIDDLEVIKWMVNEASLREYWKINQIYDTNMTIFEDQFIRLKNLTGNKTLAIVYFWGVSDIQVDGLKKIAVEQNVTLIELDSLLNKYGKSKIYLSPQLNPPDAHPSLFAHKVIADKLYNDFKKSHLLS